MDRNLVFIFWAIFLDGLAGLSGGLLSDRWLIRRQAGLISFAAGAILAAVFLDVLPESIDSLGAVSLRWSFAGFLVLAVVEWLMGAGHHHQHEKEVFCSRALPPTLLLSDALHNLGDGAAVAAGFLVSVKAGIAVAIAVIAHEVPQEVGDYALLRAAGWRRGEALTALMGVQLTAFIGAGAVIAASELVARVNAIALSVAAGTFLYIGATDLLPAMHSEHAARTERITGFAAGILVIIIVSFAESHHPF